MVHGGTGPQARSRPADHGNGHRHRKRHPHGTRTHHRPAMTHPLFCPPPTRRQLLQATGLGSALLLPAWARSAPAGGIAHTDHDPFTLGVASGDPSPITCCSGPG
jgi:hypothetical protein